MFALIVQTVLLIATAFILGCITGCLLRRLFSPAVQHPTPVEEPVVKTRSVESVQKRDEGELPPIGHPEPVAAEPLISTDMLETAGQQPVETQSAGVVFASGEPAQPDQEKTPPQTAAVAAPPPTPPVGAPAEAGKRDNLKRIRGIGPQNEARLNDVGVFTFRQIAGWTPQDQRSMGELMAFPGRIEREGWVAQAIDLAEGRETDFSKRVDSGSVTTSVGPAVESGLGSKPDALLLDQPENGAADDLTQIRGIGSALQVKLTRLGVYHFHQIAAMSSDELRWLDTALGFPGRSERENWQQDARVLSEGGTVEQGGTNATGDMITSRQS